MLPSSFAFSRVVFCSRAWFCFRSLTGPGLAVRFPVVFRWVRNWFLRRWFPPPCFALGCSFRPLAISSAVGYLSPRMGVVSVAFLLVRWFGLVLVRFLRPRLFRSWRLAFSSGAIRQMPLSPEGKERDSSRQGPRRRPRRCYVHASATASRDALSCWRNWQVGGQRGSG